MAKAFTIKRNDKVGRYMVAARDLQAGDEILVETPFAVGPKVRSQPVCLGCYWPAADPSAVVCSTCGWPVCSEECASQPVHRDAECKVFNAAEVRYRPESQESLAAGSPQYECITPLRVLLNKDRDPERWDAHIKDMEVHTKERKEQPDWEMDNINVVKFLRDKCKLADRFSEELIQWVIGVLEINAFEVRTDNGFFVRGLYPMVAMASHNCVANTTHTIFPSESFRSHVRCTVDVPAGGELFVSYTSAIQPTLLRRENLRYAKYFDCDCSRCADPTELGTHTSSLKCTKCDNGIIMSSNPLDYEAIWKCTHCEFTIRAETLKKVYHMVQSEIEQMESIEDFDTKIQKAEKLLKKYKSVLHPKNVYMTAIRNTLIQLYGRAPGYSFGDLPDILLERKVELCQLVLEVVDVVKPGMNRFRGMVLYELHVPLMLLYRSRYEQNEFDKEEFKKKMGEVVSVLEDAVQILLLEDPSSPEGEVGRVGKQSLEQLKGSIDQL